MGGELSKEICQLVFGKLAVLQDFREQMELIENSAQVLDDDPPPAYTCCNHQCALLTSSANNMSIGNTSKQLKHTQLNRPLYQPISCSHKCTSKDGIQKTCL